MSDVALTPHPHGESDLVNPQNHKKSSKISKKVAENRKKLVKNTKSKDDKCKIGSKEKNLKSQEKFYKLPVRSKTPRLKPSTPEIQKRNTYLKESIYEYFGAAGTENLAKLNKNETRKPQFEDDLAKLEFILEGHKDSVCCLEVFDDKL